MPYNARLEAAGTHAPSASPAFVVPALVGAGKKEVLLAEPYVALPGRAAGSAVLGQPFPVCYPFQRAPDMSESGASASDDSLPTGRATLCVRGGCVQAMWIEVTLDAAKVGQGNAPAEDRSCAVTIHAAGYGRMPYGTFARASMGVEAVARLIDDVRDILRAPVQAPVLRTGALSRKVDVPLSGSAPRAAYNEMQGAPPLGRVLARLVAFAEQVYDQPGVQLEAPPRPRPDFDKIRWPWAVTDGCRAHFAA